MKNHIALVSLLVLLSGCASKYIPPVKNSKNTAQLILPKETSIGAFGTTPHIQLLKTNSKGCATDAFLLPLKKEKSTITVPANEFLIFNIQRPGYMSTCLIHLGTKFKSSSVYELKTGSCYAKIENAKNYQVTVNNCIIK